MDTIYKADRIDGLINKIERLKSLYIKENRQLKNTVKRLEMKRQKTHNQTKNVLHLQKMATSFIQSKLN